MLRHASLPSLPRAKKARPAKSLARDTSATKSAALPPGSAGRRSSGGRGGSGAGAGGGPLRRVGLIERSNLTEAVGQPVGEMCPHLAPAMSEPCDRRRGGRGASVVAASSAVTVAASTDSISSGRARSSRWAWSWRSCSSIARCSWARPSIRLLAAAMTGWLGRSPRSDPLVLQGDRVCAPTGFAEVTIVLRDQQPVRAVPSTAGRRSST